MIGYEMGSSLVGVFRYGQDFSSGDLEVWMKKWRDDQHGNTFCRGISLEVKFLGQSQTHG